ncbi:hypothetical protein Tco_1393341 [Tanacetum coccineum]
MAERPDLDEDKGGKLIDPTRFRGMVGSLMYLSASRPDRMLTKPGSHDTRRSTSVEPISWDISACSRSSKKKKSTAILSLRKAEYIALSGCCAQILWMQVFYVALNSELNVSRFTEMQKAHNVVKARCLELEAELSNLRDTIHKDNYNELLNRFSNLEVNHLNLQLKYQNLKDSFQNKLSSSVNDTPDFNSVFVIGQMKASLQGKDNVIQKMKMQESHLRDP